MLQVPAEGWTAELLLLRSRTWEPAFQRYLGAKDPILCGFSHLADDRAFTRGQSHSYGVFEAHRFTRSSWGEWK